MRVRINRSALDSWPTPERGQITYSDDQVPGFICVVGKEAKTFYLQADVGGKTKRRKLGRYTPRYSAQDARTEAMRLKADLRNGVDIFAKVVAPVPLALVTLKAGLADYLESKRGKIKETTASFYRWHIERYFADWMGKPLQEIDRKMAAERFNKITEENGWAAANNALQTLSQIFNLVSVDDDALINPVEKFKKARGGLHEKKRRDGAIRPHDLIAWREAIDALEDETQRDYFMLVLYTGMRRTEAATFHLDKVAWRDGTFTIPDTKNGKPLTLPLTRQARAILERRQQMAGKSPWAFPSPDSESGHIADPMSSVRRVRGTIARGLARQLAELHPTLAVAELRKLVDEAVAASSAARFYTHALRNTFINVGRRVLRIDRDLVKRLVNHALDRDVTEGYAGDWTIYQLREPAQRIADTIEGMLTKTDNVVPLVAQA